MSDAERNDLYGHPDCYSSKGRAGSAAIKVCGRSLHVATDDFVFPGAISVFLRLVWVATASVALYRYINRSDSCQLPDNDLPLYMYVAVGMTGFVALLDGVIMVASGSGSVSDVAARQTVLPLLLVRVILAVPEAAWLVVGTVWVWWEGFSDVPCEETHLKLVRVVVGMAWAFFVIMTLIGVGAINWLGSSRLFSSDPSDGVGRQRSPTRARQRAWLRLCGLCCCACVPECRRPQPEFRATLMEVTRLLATFFNDTIVPSDIFAGLTLVAELQRLRGEDDDMFDEMLPAAQYGPCKAWRSTGRDGSVIYPSSEFGSVSLESRTSREAFEQVTHFMNFALASYGWPFMAFEGPINGCCMLVPNCRCCIECQSDQPGGQPRPVILHDCIGSHCNTAAVIGWTGVEYDDIIYADYKGEFEDLPFFVALDHSHQAVVVSIRGTLSLEDALADLRAQQEEIEGHPGLKAHKGMLRSARTIKEKMQQIELDAGWHPIKRAFQRAPQQGSGYELVIVGHSLGAGVAALLSILYRNEYPNVRCYAYSPPGALMNEACTRFAAEFTISVILGYDIVGRLTVPALAVLAREIHTVLAQTKQSKAEIFCTACCSTRLPCLPCCQTFDTGFADSSLRATASTPLLGTDQADEGDGDEREPVLQRDMQMSAILTRQPSSPTTIGYGSTAEAGTAAQARPGGYSREKYPAMYPPGRVMHLVQQNEDMR
eukprot:scpid36815/ scgid19746/ Sn1-specific diacylglycerol lipase alpha; Neural stem cell-derived dendrite regulator